MLSPKVSKTVWIGRGLSLLPILLFAMSAFMKLSPNPDSAKQMAALGIPDSFLMTLAALEISCLVIYAIPKTSVLGAILLTGYLGGAIFAHLRVGENVMIQVLLGLLVWGGLYLRESRLHSLLPLRK
jgi:hypothetical protein